MKKKGKQQITNVRNQKGDITVNSTGIKRILKYYKVFLPK